MAGTFASNLLVSFSCNPFQQAEFNPIEVMVIIIFTDQPRVSLWDNGRYSTFGHQLNGMLLDTVLSPNLPNCSQMAPILLLSPR